MNHHFSARIKSVLLCKISPRCLALALLATAAVPAPAQIIFSESFESPVVSGLALNTVPNNGKWIGAIEGFGSTTRGLFNENVAWPATPAFSTPYGDQGYILDYSNSGLTTATNAIPGSFAADVTYTVKFNAAIRAGAAASTYQVELVAFTAADNNAARLECRGNRPGTVLATATGPVTTNNMSVRGSLVFTPTVSNTNLGKEIGLRLIKNSGSVIYDNLRLITGHDPSPSPDDGVTMAAGSVPMSWVNFPPNVGTDVYVDVWFGTNAGALTKIVNGGLNVTNTTVSAPVAATYYWRVDSYLDGSFPGTPVTGTIFKFFVTDTDGDGFSDSYELAHTIPPSSTSLNPTNDLDSDLLNNLEEYNYGTDPNDSDTDNDTLQDGPELTGVGSRPPTSPVDFDSDDDGLSDGVESNTSTWVSSANTGTSPTDADWDNDGLKDGAETKTGIVVSRFNSGTDPYLADTDGDGAGDWYEVVAAYTDPQVAASKPAIPYPLPDPDNTPPATNKPVKVFILSGQSNMVGIGQTGGTEPGTLETISKRENKFPNLVNATNGWTVRNDVTYKGVISATAAGGLTAGQGASSSQLGPELGFGQVVGYHLDEPVLLIKASQGNRSLAWDFLPPGSLPYTNGGTVYAGYGNYGNWAATNNPPAVGGWYGGKQYDDCFLKENNMGAPAWALGKTYNTNHVVSHNGAIYTHKSVPPIIADASSEPGIGANATNYWNNYSVDNTADVLDNFNANYPAYAAQGFQIEGFVWWQGHKDQDAGEPYPSRYETNLVNLITQLRAYYGNRYPGKVKPNTPFVLATIGFNGWAMTNNPGQVDAVKVANAQLAVSNPTNYPAFAGNVKTIESRGYWREAAESPRNQDYHYNQNAETYMLVGDALGRAMIELLNTGPDTNAPGILSLNPANGATNISVGANLVATFNEGISLGTGNLTITNLTDATQTTIAVTNNTQVSISGTTLTINPTANLLPAKLYAIQIAPTAITDMATNAFPGIANTTIWSFTTAIPDLTAPTLLTLSPTNGSTGVLVGTNLVATFSEAIAIGTGNLTLTNLTDATQITIAVTDGTQVSVSGSVLTINPTANLTPGKQYAVLIQVGAIKDLSNNPFGGIAGVSTWSFTTEPPDLTAPTIVTFSPANGATGVAADVNLVATFTEPIVVGDGDITLTNLTDATQITIAVTNDALVSVAGSVLTINPPSSLLAGKQYAIRMDPGVVSDLSDNPFVGIANDTTWSFTIASQAAGLVFADNFEPGTNSFGGITPNVTNTYTVDNTSGQANIVLWVRASSGYNSSRNGLVDESENGGGNFTDPDGEQAYGFRYTNTGLTSNTNKVGALTAGTTITVTFDVVRDGYNGGSNYNALLVLFTNGAPRNAVETENKNTAAVLAKKSGNIPNTGNYQPISFSYVVGTNVVDNNGDASGVSTTFLAGLLGKDIALRFDGESSSANIDNVQVVVTGAAASASTNAFLNSLVLSPAGALSPVFGSNVFSYTATEAYGNSPTVTVLNADLTATNHLIYNGNTNLLASSVASSPLPLTLGAVNPVVVRVTAQDGVTVKTYSVNVTMQPSLTPPPLTKSASGGLLNLSWPASHLGYTLQVQTNARSQGLGNNWFPVVGSVSITSTNLPLDNAAGTVFYRLVFP